MIVEDLYAENDKSFHCLSITFHIVQEVAKRLGEEIENPFNGMQSPHTISEISRSLENKISMCTGFLAVNQVGSWPTQMEQDEALIESANPLTGKAEHINDETMKLFLDLLTVLLELCPAFTVSLTAVQGNGRDGGLLAEFAVDAAVKSITGDDVDSVKSAIHFLQSLVSNMLCHVHCLAFTCKYC